MRVLTLALAGVLTLAAGTLAGAAEQGPILPGYWESTSKASFPVASNKTERKCIAAKAINSYLTGPVNNHYSCHYDTQSLDHGHAHMTGECVDNNGLRSKVVIDGTYAAEAFNLDAKLQVMLGGLAIPVSTSIDAHRLSGECPAGIKVEGGEDKPGDSPKAGG
jgi:hypothetical protein